MKRTTIVLSLTMILLFKAVAGTPQVNLATANPMTVLPYITIKSDGTIEPQTEFITQIGNVYSLTANLSDKYAIAIKCNNIIFDGAGQLINGVSSQAGYPALNNGLKLQDVKNVTVRNVGISGFNDFDISIENCNSCFIQRVKANTFNLDNSHLNTINESEVAGNDINVQAAIIMSLSNDNKVYKNNINGIILKDSNNNIFFENNIVFQHTFIFGSSENNSWDNYSVGNYWSDYPTRYPNASEIDNTGINNTPYVIDTNNTDHYPLTFFIDIAPTPTPPENRNPPHLDLMDYVMNFILPIFIITVVAIITLLIYRRYQKTSSKSSKSL